MAESTVASATRAIEHRDIHAAVCRYRRQRLICSLCVELAERTDLDAADRAAILMLLKEELLAIPATA
jgi:hypothetical protein